MKLTFQLTPSPFVNIGIDSGSEKIYINMDTIEKLDKHFNRKQAAQIIKMRPFNSLDDLEQVHGIGPATVERLKKDSRVCLEYLELNKKLSVRDSTDSYQWKKFKNFLLKEEGKKCWICGVENAPRYEAHKFWNFSDVNHIAELKEIHHLCTLCHTVKHIDRNYSYLKLQLDCTFKSIDARDNTWDKIKSALTAWENHFKNVNNCSAKEYEDYCNKEWVIWHERNQHNWTRDFGKYSFLLKKGVKKIENSDIKSFIEKDSLWFTKMIYEKHCERRLEELRKAGILCAVSIHFHGMVIKYLLREKSFCALYRGADGEQEVFTKEGWVETTLLGVFVPNTND